MRIALAVAAGLLIVRTASATNILTENFDEPGGFFGGSGYHSPSFPIPDWQVVNNSNPLGQNSWMDSPNTHINNFTAQSGSSYAGVESASGSGTSTLSNWLITPQITFSAGDQLSFYTRTVPTVTFPDRLQVRLSTAGSSFDVGTDENSVGDFSTLLVDINPTYKVFGGGSYPTSWTQFTISLPTSGSGRIGFRYFVENGGPNGDNSQFIGLDTISVVGTAPNFIQWGSSIGGSWNNAANWSTGIPNAAAAKAKFLSAPTGLTAPGTITLDAAITVGQLTFDNINSHAIAPGTGGTLAIDDTGDTGGVNPLIAVTNGSHSISAPISMAAGLTLTTTTGTALNITGNLTGTGNVTISGGGSITLGGALPATAAINANSATTFTGSTNNVTLNRSIAALNIGSGATATLGSSTFAGHPLVLAATTLAFADSTAKLDLTNNAIIATGSASDARSLIVTTGQVFSSTLTPTTAIGYMNVPASSNMEMRVTLKGDTNLDGSVDVGDLGALATSYGLTTGALWPQGDFNNDGAVDVGDLGSLATNYGASLASGPAAGVSASVAVPEPAVLGLALVCTIVGFGRGEARKRRGRCVG